MTRVAPETACTHHGQPEVATMRIAESKFKALAFIALGSNLGDSREIISGAMELLARLSDVPLLRSSLWKTSPVDCPVESPPFINAVVGLRPRPEETPVSLLGQLQELEKEFGREPKKLHNEPRPLDLDLIAFGSQIRNTQRLTLPHPRAHERRFVLAPLDEVAPNLILPGESKTVRELLVLASPEEIVEKLPPSPP
jgi:2-amino-4-hydroxy-6-hydroxymethyldihydropteridine diphosphokinase